MYRWLTVLAVLLGTTATATATAAVKDRPNIVVILADDLGSGDLGCYNKDSKIPTPRMDRLASQGMRFTDAHTPSSVCSPTRYGPSEPPRRTWRPISRLVRTPRTPT